MKKFRLHWLCILIINIYIKLHSNTDNTLLLFCYSSQISENIRFYSGNILNRSCQTCARHVSFKPPITKEFSQTTENVQPVPKNGCKTLLANCGPIMLLPINSKVMESTINSKILKHLEVPKILYVRLYGFCS